MPPQSTPRRPPSLRNTPSLIAEFATADEARAAIDALENHGIDGLEISLLDAPAEARQDPADQRIVRYLGERTARGVGLGAAIGAAAFGVAAVVFAVLGWPAGAVAGTVLAGAVLGGTVGAFLSFERSVGESESWDWTFMDTLPKPVRLGVHTLSDTDALRARRVLEHLHPLHLRSSAQPGAN
jgi:hypothetical protein